MHSRTLLRISQEMRQASKKVHHLLTNVSSPTEKRRSHAPVRISPRSRHLSPVSHTSNRRSHGHFESRRELASTHKRIANNPGKFFCDEQRVSIRRALQVRANSIILYRKSCTSMYGLLYSHTTVMTATWANTARSAAVRPQKRKR